MKRVPFYWATAGAVIPLAILLLVQVEVWMRRGLIWRLDLVQLLLWPTSVALLLNKCANCSDFSPFGILLLIISIALNSLCYVVLGLGLWWLFGHTK